MGRSKALIYSMCDHRHWILVSELFACIVTYVCVCFFNFCVADFSLYSWRHTWLGTVALDMFYFIPFGSFSGREIAVEVVTPGVNILPETWRALGGYI